MFDLQILLLKLKQAEEKKMGLHQNFVAACLASINQWQGFSYF